MKFLSFSLKLLLLLMATTILIPSCKDDENPCQEGDPAIVGALCNDGFASNLTGTNACFSHEGVDNWLCNDDQFTTATISGKITILNSDLWATWQDSGEVQLTIFPAFSLNPPAGWGDIPANALYPGFPGGRFALGAPYNAQNPIVLTYVPGKTEYEYQLEVEPGTYSALAVGLRHDLITDPSLRTATLGVHFGQPASVSHGIVFKIDVGGGQIITVFDEPAPSAITVVAGDELEINFTADFAFVEAWFQ